MLEWRPFFPEAEPRPLQVEILDWLTLSYDTSDAFIVEAPPGVGKSAIALCMARWLWALKREQTFISTTTVNLEDQYLASYRGVGLRQLHSAVHFPCSRRDRRGAYLNCEEGRSLSASIKRDCPGAYCPYSAAKGLFIKSPYGILNSAYLLTESAYAGQLGQRGLLIADEGHSLCNEVCKFLGFQLTRRAAGSLALSWPVIPEGDSELRLLCQWLSEEFKPALLARIVGLEVQIEHFGANHQQPEEDPGYVEWVREWQKAKTELGRLNQMLRSVREESWIVERTGSENRETFDLLPVSARGFSKGYLGAIAGKLILLSATFLDFSYHAAELELDHYLKFEAPSPFPVENRMIYAIPRLKMDSFALEESARDAAELILPLLEFHPAERGLIVTSSYAQADAVREAVNARLGTQRLIGHRDSKGKSLLLTEHSARDNSVLISPSFHEGVDLKGDLSTFQIITKLPFPSLGSKAVRKRRELIPEWYSYATALKLIQATGRSVRSESDRANTYILDKDFGWFYPRYQRLFPEYWQAAVKYWE